jgi:c(7)-type cytochrome triheme protein
MQEIFDGKYCGACHGKVAFTNTDCQLCHSGEIY